MSFEAGDNIDHRGYQELHTEPHVPSELGDSSPEKFYDDLSQHGLSDDENDVVSPLYSHTRQVENVESAIAEVSTDFVTGHLSLSQYPVPGDSQTSSLSQYPLNDTEDKRRLEHSATDTQLSQHSIEDEDGKLMSRQEPVGEEDFKHQSLGGRYRLDTPRSVESFTTESDSGSSRSSHSQRLDVKPVQIKDPSGVRDEVYNVQYPIKYLPEPPPKADNASLVSSTTPESAAESDLGMESSHHQGSPKSTSSQVSRVSAPSSQSLGSLPSSQGQVYTSKWVEEYEVVTGQGGGVSDRMSGASTYSTLQGRLSQASTMSGPSVKRARWDEPLEGDNGQVDVLGKYLLVSPEEIKLDFGDARAGQDQDSIVFGDTNDSHHTNQVTELPVGENQTGPSMYFIGIEDPIQEAKMKIAQKREGLDVANRNAPLKADHNITVPVESLRDDGALVTTDADGCARVSWGAGSEGSGMSVDSIATSRHSHVQKLAVPIKPSLVKLPIDLSQLDKPTEYDIERSGRSEKSVDSGRESSARLSGQSFQSRTSGGVPLSSYIEYPRELRSTTPNDSTSTVDRSSSKDETSELLKRAGVDYVSAEERSKLLSDTSSQHSVSRGPSFSPSGPTKKSEIPTVAFVHEKSVTPAYVPVEDRRRLLGLSPEEIEARRASMAFSITQHEDVTQKSNFALFVKDQDKHEEMATGSLDTAETGVVVTANQDECEDEVSASVSTVESGVTAGANQDASAVTAHSSVHRERGEDSVTSGRDIQQEMTKLTIVSEEQKMEPSVKEESRSSSARSDRSRDRPKGDGQENQQGTSPAFAFPDRTDSDILQKDFEPTQAVYPHRKGRTSKPSPDNRVDGAQVDILKIDNSRPPGSTSGGGSDRGSARSSRSAVDEVQSLLSSTVHSLSMPPSEVDGVHSSVSAATEATYEERKSKHSGSLSSDVPSLVLDDLLSEHGSAKMGSRQNREDQPDHVTLPEPPRTDRPSSATSLATSELLALRTSDIDSVRTDDTIQVSPDVEQILQRYEHRKKDAAFSQMDMARQRLSPVGSDVSHDSLARRVNQLLTRKSAGEDSLKSKHNSRSPKQHSRLSDYQPLSLNASVSIPMDFSMSDASTELIDRTNVGSPREQHSRVSASGRRSPTEQHVEVSSDTLSSVGDGHITAVPFDSQPVRRDSISSYMSTDSMARRVQDLLNPVDSEPAPDSTTFKKPLKPSFSLQSLQSEDSMSRRVADLLNPLQSGHHVPSSKATALPSKMKPSFSTQSLQSEDSLSRRVEDLLAETRHLDGSMKLGGKTLIDYDALRQDLDDIEQSLSMHSFSRMGELSGSREGSRTPQDGSQDSSPAGATLSKRLTWDHGADLAYNDHQEYFVDNSIRPRSSDSAVSVGQLQSDGKSPAKKKDLSRIQPLLTGGIVPVDLALDIMDSDDLKGGFDDQLWTYRSDASTVRPGEETHRSQKTEGDRWSPSNKDLPSDGESMVPESIIDQVNVDYNDKRMKIPPRVSALSKTDHYSSTDSLARKVSDILEKDVLKKQASEILNEAERTEKSLQVPRLDRSYIQYPPELASSEDEVQVEYDRLRQLGTQVKERPASRKEEVAHGTQEKKRQPPSSLDSATLTGLSDNPTSSESRHEDPSQLPRAEGFVDRSEPPYPVRSHSRGMVPYMAGTPLGPRDVRLHPPRPPLLHSVERIQAPLHRPVDSFLFTPLAARGPLTSTATARTFMANQLEKMAQRRYGGLDLRTPFRRAHDDLDIGRFDSVLHPSDVHSSHHHEAPDVLLLDPNTRGRSHSDPVEASFTNHRASLPRQVWENGDLQQQRQRDDVYRHSLSHSSQECPHRARAPPGGGDLSISRVGQELPAQHDSLRRLSPANHPAEHRGVDTRPTPSYVDTSVGHVAADRGATPSEASQDSSHSREESEEKSRTTSPAENSGRRSSEMAGLRPYKPRGSQDVYYVESSSVDESNMSTAQSETTMESTHTGSDDAEGPPISARHFGTRPDSARIELGIYGSRMRKSPKSKTSYAAPHLRTIKEGDVRREMEDLERTLERALHTSVQRSAELSMPRRDSGLRSSGPTKDLSGIRRQFEDSSRHAYPSPNDDDLRSRPPKSFIEYPSSLRSKDNFTPLVPDEDEGSSPTHQRSSPERRSPPPRHPPPHSTARSPPKSPPLSALRPPTPPLPSPPKSILKSPQRSPPRSPPLSPRLSSLQPLLKPSHQQLPRSSSAEPLVGRDYDGAHTLDMLRDALQDDSATSLPPDINDMWERFDRMYRSRDRDSGERVLRFCDFVRNPVQHILRNFSQERGARLRSAELELQRNERRRAREKVRRDVESRKMEEMRAADSSIDLEILAQQTSAKQNGKVEMKAQPELKKESQQEVGSKETRFVLADRENEIEKEARRVIEECRKFNRMHGDELLSPPPAVESTPIDGPPKSKLISVFKKGSAQTVPAEDVTVDSVSSSLTDASLDSDKLYRVFDRNRKQDPNYLRLQRRIQKQKEKHERERLKHAKRKEKVKKLEALLAAKKRREVESISSISTTSTVASTDSGTSIDGDSLAKTLTPVPEMDSTLVGGNALAQKNTSNNAIESSRKGKVAAEECSSTESATDGSTCACCRKSSRTKDGKKKKKEVTEKPTDVVFKKNAAYYEFKKPTQPAPKSRTKTIRRHATPMTPAKVSNKKRDAAVMYPSPLEKTPPRECKRTEKIIMVSEAVQTTPQLAGGGDGDNGRGFVSVPVSPPRVGPGAVFQKVAHNDTAIKPKLKSKENKPPAGSAVGPGGLAWYVPAEEPKIWKQPLKQRQYNALATEPWYSSTRRGRPVGSASDTVVPADDGPMILLSKSGSNAALKTSDGENIKSSRKLSLQEAFQMAKPDFISRSRERQRRIALAADERWIQGQHTEERALLFADQRKKRVNPDAHPYSERLHRPRKRTFTKKEIVAHSKKIYQSLPEVKQAVAKKNWEQEQKTNRLRAQLFKTKVLEKVLNKRKPWVAQ